MLLPIFVVWLYLFAFLLVTIPLLLLCRTRIKTHTSSTKIFINKLIKLFSKALIFQILVSIFFAIGLYFIRPLHIKVNAPNDLTVQEITISKIHTVIKNKKINQVNSDYLSFSWIDNIHIQMLLENTSPATFEIKKWDKSHYLNLWDECEIFLEETGQHKVECVSY